MNPHPLRLRSFTPLKALCSITSNMKSSSISIPKLHRKLGVMAAVLAVAASALLTAPYASGGLLVSSTFTNDVKRYNGTTGAFIDNFASGGGLDGSIGLAFGPDGNLYVGSFYTDSVKRYDGTTGAFIDDFASGGGLDGTGELIFSPVPEPAAIATGLLCLGVAALRRRRRA